MKTPPWRFIPLFGGIGVVLLAVGFVLLVSTIRFRAGAQQADGTVVELPRRGGGYATTFEFTDLSGKSRRVTTSWSSDPAAFRVGETIRVYFDPEHPDEARLDGFMENWFPALIVLVFGLGFGAVGALIAVARARLWRGRPPVSGGPDARLDRS